MNWETLAWIALGLASWPFLLFLANSRVYRPLLPLPQEPNELGHRPDALNAESAGVSVLIPARNEEANLPATLESVLSNAGVDLELIVLDDHSSDRTAAIVREFQARDSRVRLEAAPPLPPGWCGKQHACHVLSRLSNRRWLVFMDADVRLHPQALQQMVRFMEESRADLASGIPRQETGSFSEKLLIPLIHFILLGFLPMHAMRRSASPSFAAGCGQLFVACRRAYRECGGHSKIPATLHDGLRLPRVFRQAGFRTDLFDATPLATCRMYRNGSEVWCGLAKNAIEGLAAPKRILPMSFLLAGGQVLPWIVALAGWSALGNLERGAALTAIALAMVPRLLSVRRYHQSLVGALLHPVGILALLLIQWFALVQYALGRPATWKGRSYSPESVRSRPASAVGTALLLGGALLVASSFDLPSSGADAHSATEFRLGRLTLDDQYGARHDLSFPAAHITVMTCADREGAAEVSKWVSAVKSLGYDTNQVVLCGVADVRKVPSVLRGMIRRRFVERYTHPILMDWKGQIAGQPFLKSGSANVLLLDRTGRLVGLFLGEPTPGRAQELADSIRALIKVRPTSSSP
ncbi:MAG: glycosyltransferase [Verrucomicrobiales bacterium]|nr:glycosyltransferase [Verrucomicrobiales bacterium]